MASEKISVRCCIAAGGPAGMMPGCLLARGGVHVVRLAGRIPIRMQSNLAGPLIALLQEHHWRSLCSCRSSQAKN
ncbi:MAG: hypothetical protein ACREQO_09270 [Candidatus Binatia bacterium]